MAYLKGEEEVGSTIPIGIANLTNALPDTRDYIMDWAGPNHLKVGEAVYNCESTTGQGRRLHQDLYLIVSRPYLKTREEEVSTYKQPALLSGLGKQRLYPIKPHLKIGEEVGERRSIARVRLEALEHHVHVHLRLNLLLFFKIKR